MGKKLFVIGNGFDLFHDLPTTYYDLREYFRRPIEYYNWHDIFPDENYLDSIIIMDELIMNTVFEDWDILEKTVAVNINKSAPLNKLGRKILKVLGIPVVDKTFLWSDFEGVLGRIDFSEYLKDEEYGPHSIINAFESLQLAFPEWINSIDIINTIPNFNFMKLIDYMQDLFLTFNYTRTLEKIYNIPEENICHIHGECGEKLIFGHSGLNEEDFLNKNAISGFEDFAEEIFNYFTKEDKMILRRNRDFFERLVDVEEIYVMGFSFSSCDLRYINEICHTVPNASWHLNSYDSEEKRKNYANIIRAFGAKGSIDSYDLPVEKKNNVKKNKINFGKIIKAVIRSWLFNFSPCIELIFFGFDPENERKFFVKPYIRSILYSIFIFMILVFSTVLNIIFRVKNSFQRSTNIIKGLINKKHKSKEE